MLTNWLEERPFFGSFLDFIFPPLCAGCESFCEEKNSVCLRCRGKIDFFASPLCLTCGDPISSGIVCRSCHEKTMPLMVVGDYADPLRSIIVGLKFRGAVNCVGYFSEIMVEMFGSVLEQLAVDYLVPIPLHPSREHLRGYNQALLLAEAIGAASGLPVDNDLILRRRKGKPQSRLSFEKREANVRSAFAPCLDTPRADKPRVVLVDDVVTSGATFREAAQAVTEGGGQVVGGLALAHGIQEK